LAWKRDAEIPAEAEVTLPRRAVLRDDRLHLEPEPVIDDVVRKRDVPDLEMVVVEDCVRTIIYLLAVFIAR
jgi:hypothetical protein